MGQGVGALKKKGRQDGSRSGCLKKKGGGGWNPLANYDPPWGLPSFMESRQSEFFRFFRVKLQEHTNLKLT